MVQFILNLEVLVMRIVNWIFNYKIFHFFLCFYEVPSIFLKLNAYKKNQTNNLIFDAEFSAHYFLKNH